MLHPELTTQMAREQYNETLRNRRRAEKIAGLPKQPPFTRRAARPLGRMLLWLGARLLRYGQAEAQLLTTSYQPNPQTIKLN